MRGMFHVFILALMPVDLCLLVDVMTSVLSASTLHSSALSCVHFSSDFGDVRELQKDVFEELRDGRRLCWQPWWCALLNE
jgi:hypothetical protein